MQMMADCAGKEDIVADVGTDHGYIPIWLMQNDACRDVILCDINSGPLEKAAENIRKYMPHREFDMRLGSGIAVLEQGEADTVIIAGMGGNLIRDILEDDLGKTMSFPRFVLQPRNHAALLRQWISDSGKLRIVRELLAEEDGRLCEIIVAENRELIPGSSDTEEKLLSAVKNAEILAERAQVPEEIALELPLFYFTEEIPYAKEHLRRKTEKEEKIIRHIEEKGQADSSSERLAESRVRLDAFRRIADLVYGEGSAAGAPGKEI